MNKNKDKKNQTKNSKIKFYPNRIDPSLQKIQKSVQQKQMNDRSKQNMKISQNNNKGNIENNLMKQQQWKTKKILIVDWFAIISLTIVFLLFTQLLKGIFLKQSNDKGNQELYNLITWNSIKIE